MVYTSSFSKNQLNAKHLNWTAHTFSVGKESAFNAGDPSSIPGSGRSTGEGICYPLQYSWVSLVAQLVKNPACNVVDLGSIPGLGRSPGKGKSYPLQYSGLENSSPWGSQRVGHDWATFTFTHTWVLILISHLTPFWSTRKGQIKWMRALPSNYSHTCVWDLADRFALWLEIFL